MAGQSKKDSRKGFFSDVRLPVAKTYVYPPSRRAMVLVGGGGALLILAVFAFNLTLQRGTLISNGPLSSNHAVFGDDCSTCHTPFGDVTDAQCSVCHEKYGDRLGLHTFAAHYLYRSGDLSRAVARPDEPACFACHTEHVGRDAPITRVDDAPCLACHRYGSFNRRHPEFDVIAAQTPDPANLSFPHALHVREVQTFEDLPDLEASCLYCHNPQPDGKAFQPLDFALHCAACHLNAGEGTGFVPVATPGAPGVLTLATIRARQAPGTAWAASVSPGDFEDRGGQVRKRPLAHADPWVLYNLRRLRWVLYPNDGLADLIQASADVPPDQAAVLYEEALATLRDYADGLRAQPEREVQDDLREIDRLLDLVARRLRDPATPLDATRFALTRAGVPPAAYQNVIDQLTRPCQTCHQVDRATLLRPQPDQRVLRRAAFDHRAHVIDLRCLDCHTAIPIEQLIAPGDDDDPARDNAVIQNLPPLATCQSCHTASKASNACITCHLFHPDKSQRANLLPYMR